MTRVAWASDIHLNFLNNGAETVATLVNETRADLLLIGGDISEGPEITDDLKQLAKLIDLPIFFVLGNHDFYWSSLVDVRERVGQVVDLVPNLTWLTQSAVVALSDCTALIGHDLWADGRNGNSYLSQVELTDFDAIEDFRAKSKLFRFHLMSTLGDNAVAGLRTTLPEALALRDHVVLLTHVPPFAEACVYQDAPSSDQFLPHLSCKAAGDYLTEVMRQHPEKRLTVLSGHTHGRYQVDILPNLRIYVAGANYGEPAIEHVFEV